MQKAVTGLTTKVKQLDGEQILLIFFLVVSGYMFLDAYQFAEDPRRFPQVTAMMVFISCVLLLARDYVPEFLSALVSDESQFGDSFEYNEEIQDIQRDYAQADPAQESQTRSTIVGPGVFTTLTITGYVAGSYLFGLLWITPVFVGFYMWWFRIKWWIILLISVISTLIAYLFVLFLYAPFTRGVIFNPGVLRGIL